MAELNGEVIACVALHDYSAGLFEIRSLAVVPEYNAQGIGRQLVLKAIDQAGAKSGKRVFALTKKGAFFEKLGFQQGEKELFPQKVWQDCQLCHKRDRCDEDAYYFDIA